MRIDSFVPTVSATASFAQRLAPPTGGRTDAGSEDRTAEHQSRLTAIVELIRALTGREVELVPPAPYFVSAPTMPEPVTVKKPEPVELTLPQRPWGARDEQDGQDPLRVDITDVLRRGTTRHMRLDAGPEGRLALFADLDLEL